MNQAQVENQGHSTTLLYGSVSNPPSLAASSSPPLSPRRASSAQVEHNLHYKSNRSDGPGTFSHHDVEGDESQVDEEETETLISSHASLAASPVPSSLAIQQPNFHQHPLDLTAHINDSSHLIDSHVNQDHQSSPNCHFSPSSAPSFTTSIASSSPSDPHLPPSPPVVVEHQTFPSISSSLLNNVNGLPSAHNINPDHRQQPLPAPQKLSSHSELVFSYHPPPVEPTIVSASSASHSDAHSQSYPLPTGLGPSPMASGRGIEVHPPAPVTLDSHQLISVHAGSSPPLSHPPSTSSPWSPPLLQNLPPPFASDYPPVQAHLVDSVSALSPSSRRQDPSERPSAELSCSDAPRPGNTCIPPYNLVDPSQHTLSPTERISLDPSVHSHRAFPSDTDPTPLDQQQQPRPLSTLPPSAAFQPGLPSGSPADTTHQVSSPVVTPSISPCSIQPSAVPLDHQAVVPIPERKGGSQSLRSSKNADPSLVSPTSNAGPSRTPSQQNAATAAMPVRSRRHLGEYILSKTLGAGSMGKVKLAVSSITGEKIAIKIIPRHTSLAAAQQQMDRNKENNGTGPSEGSHAPDGPSHSFIEKAKAKDISKEVRTIREASIVLLLHHPYVCGMKSMLVYPHHYYMLFEYVNGGQMLDYIISHGRLRERAARKFARQMGSALEYCHANSIVHRDLKIENILISKTGNIKIIDFGLSNLFSPNSNLQTFCGSLYFAAPELLNAKVYIGPEVDVWSFGIVLFVLVCGKVPFDDQSMPALHAKIKRGQVEYPNWLSSECKHLLSRMLVTNPTHRATLYEVLNHTWMLKGHDGPPDPHIPHRDPLRAHQIDPDVVRGMTGFEFGSPEKIEAELHAVLSSEIYLRVLKLYDEKRATGFSGPIEPVYHTPNSGSTSSMSVLANGSRKDNSRGDRENCKAPNKSTKRFSGFGFYSKKVAGGLAAVLGTVGGGKVEEKSNVSDTNLPAATGFEPILLNGQTLDSLDPTRGFHPLISIYFLVREKIEREKIYGPGVFASSTLSLTGPPPPIAPPSAYKSALSPPHPGLGPATEEVSIDGRSPAKSRTSMAGCRLDGNPRESIGGVLDVQQNSRTLSKKRSPLPARPSTATERMVTSIAVSAPSSPIKAANLTISRNSRPHTSSTSTMRRSVHIMTSPEGTSLVQELNSFPAPDAQRAGLGVVGGNGRTDRVLSMIESSAVDSSAGRPEVERSPSASFAKRFGSFLGRSSSVAEPDYKRHRPRSSIGGSGHKSGTKTPLGPLPQVVEAAAAVPDDFLNSGELQQQQSASRDARTHRGETAYVDEVPRSAPVGGQMHHHSNPNGREIPKIRSPQHHRSGSDGSGFVCVADKPLRQGSQTFSPPQSASAGSTWGPTAGSSQPSEYPEAGVAARNPSPLMESEEDGEEADETQVQEDESQQVIGNAIRPDHGVSGNSNNPDLFGKVTSPSRSSDKIKPIYLKGLFSVATTSTRGPKVLRDDLIKVLNRIGVHHREIKGGFECAHVPSIDLSSVGTHAQGAFVNGLSVSKKTIGRTLRNKVSSHVKSSAASEKNKIGEDRSEGSNSQVGGDLTAPVTPPIGGLTTPPPISAETEDGRLNRFLSPGGGPAVGGPVGGTSLMTQKKYDLVVRFEIFIVKMPLLPGINGLQFRRISGNAWQYHTFARRILQELKL